MIWLLKRVEIIVAKGEIAHYEQFILLPQWFQKWSPAEASESVYIWEWVKHAKAKVWRWKNHLIYMKTLWNICPLQRRLTRHELTVSPIQLANRRLWKHIDNSVDIFYKYQYNYRIKLTIVNEPWDESVVWYVLKHCGKTCPPQRRLAWSE